MNGLTFNELMNLTEGQARGLVEKQRWPNGPFCPHCGGAKVYRLQARVDSKRPVRDGVYKCAYCRKQFTVKVGTIFEDTHIPLKSWVVAIHLMCASKKGISSHQLHRMLDITYKSAWFLSHRIRWAMTQPPLADKLQGTVEVDETYVGGKPRKGGPPSKRGRGTKKAPVVALVERNGRVRSFHIKRITTKNLRAVIRQHVAEESHMMTDELNVYDGLDKDFASHEKVQHGAGEYSRNGAHVNTAESYFSLLKRSLYGTFHHVSKDHLHRYLAELNFRFDARGIKDAERTLLAITATEGKRLTYRPLTQKGKTD